MNWKPANWLATAIVSCLPAGAAAASESASKPGVVLLHGIHDSGEKMAWLAWRLQREGYETFCPTLTPGDGSVSLADSSAALDKMVAAHFGLERPLHVVGFSMGGLITRHWLANYPARERVVGFSTLGSPHRGTWFAYVNQLPGVVNMRPNSPFLQKLAEQDDTLAGLRPLSVYTPFDLIILPAHSSVWERARAEKYWLVAHPLLVFSPTVARRLLGYFSERESEVVR